MSSEEESELDSDLDSEEQESEDSSDYDFLAFVVVKEQSSDLYNVIPSSWVLCAFDYDTGDQTTVEYVLPSDDLLGTGVKFGKNKKPDMAWPQFEGDMLFESDSQADAFKFIKDDMRRERKYSRLLELLEESDSKEKEPKPSGTKRKESEHENENEKNPKKSKTSTDPAPAASTSSTVSTSKLPATAAPK